jgi:hypothetical protein
MQLNTSAQPRQVRVDGCWIRGESLPSSSTTTTSTTSTTSTSSSSSSSSSELGALEGFGLFVGKESVIVMERVNVLRCRRAQLAIGDESKATVRRRRLHLGFKTLKP